MVLALCYVYLIIYFSDAWDDLPEWSVPPAYLPSISVAVVIPVRNEGKNIVSLIQDLLDNDFPGTALRIYVIDDHSTDNTADVLLPYHDRIEYLSLPEGCYGKKAAMSLGIQSSQAELIICLDGDCRLGRYFLASVTSYFDNHAVDFVTGLVSIEYKIGTLEAMQYLDLAGTMVIGAAGIKKKKFYIANGANMAFRKETFNVVNGFHGNENVSSGDDMFLIKKIANLNPEKVHFLKCKDAVVTTRAERRLSDLFHQRKRWATKAKYFRHSHFIRLQVFVAIVQIWILLCFLISCLTGGIGIFMGLFVLFIKWVMDYLLVAKICRYYENTNPLKYFIPGAVLQFIVYGYASFSAIFSKSYLWKGRKAE